jgi:CO dehydrogenase/acetyl-CoA synthase alpha subunit
VMDRRGRGQNIVGGTIPGLVVLGSLRNKANQAVRSKAVGSTASRFLPNLRSCADCDSGV